MKLAKLVLYSVNPIYLTQISVSYSLFIGTYK